jgi:predicted NUDIX family NTP pyrophosphohydrolase
MTGKSAGLLLFRVREGGLEVMLVHPGGPFWAKKDEHAWSVPKGEIHEGEDPLRAAQREFEEEIGSPAPAGETIPLEPVNQTGGKRVLAWAIRADFDPSALRSNTISMEWPPRSGRTTTFPEIDRAAWFPIDVAASKIHKGQASLLEQLKRAKDLF